MESVLNNQEKNIIAPEEVVIDLDKIEQLTEQDQSPAILTEVDDELPLKTDEDAKSELERASEACKPNDELSADNDKRSEPDVTRTSNVLEQKEVEDKPEVPIENTGDIKEKDSEPLLGFESEDPITVNSSGDEESGSKGTLEVKQDEIKPDGDNQNDIGSKGTDEIKLDVDNLDDSSGGKGTLDVPKEDNFYGFVRLSGAGKKRFKFLLKKGFTPEEARELAATSLDECRAATAKRERSDDPSTSGPAKKRKITDDSKKESAAPKSPTKSQKKQQSKSVKYAILSKDYPDLLLTSNNVQKIQSSILKKIVSIKENDVKPKFLGTEFKNGYMIITCADENTGTWLKRTISDIKPWPTISLMAIKEDEITSSRMMIASLPNSLNDTNKKILAFIKAQNEQLPTTKWKICQRQHKGNGVIQVMFIVDDESVKILKAGGYKINYKFDQIPIKPNQQFNKPGNKPKKKGRKPPPRFKKKHQHHGPRSRFEQEMSSRYQRELSPRYQRELSPRYERDLSPRYERDLSPRYRDLSPRYQRELSPRYRRDLSPRYRRDLSPRYEREYSPRYEREYSPRYEREYSPQYEREYSPRYEREYSSHYERELSPRYEERESSGYSLFTAKEVGHTSRANPSIFDN